MLQGPQQGKRSNWQYFDGADIRSIDWLQQGGLYALYESGTITYIGQSKNLYSRLLTHSWSFGFDWIMVRPVKDPARRTRLERRLIHRLRPERNRQVTQTVGWSRSGVTN